ncbi:MAG: DNA polymerase I, partial [Desulfobacteraceae bacterium]|nr:DNA polymerase I [Desulfobacteraceae bacterium]
DYSQIELRILAHCANDEILIKAFQNNEDIHTRTAMEVFDVIPEFVTGDLRSQAKAINFGIVYGMSAFGLSKELEISRKMAQNYIDNYFARYAGVKSFIEATIKEAEITQEVQTLLGRKRKLSEINSSNINVKKFAHRVAVNTPIQGSAADLIKLAMIEMSKAISSHNLKSTLLLSVHDEIIFEVPENEEDSLTQLAKKVMENLFDLKVPLIVNIGSGKNWAEAH